jgi:hypothetical protein
MQLKVLFDGDFDALPKSISLKFFSSQLGLELQVPPHERVSARASSGSPAPPPPLARINDAARDVCPALRRCTAACWSWTRP